MPLAIVSAPIIPLVKASPMLLTQLVLACVDRAIRPCLLTFTMLLIVLPRSLIVSSIRMHKDSIAVCFIVEPLAFVNVAISMIKFSKALGTIVLPLTDKFCTVGPCHLSLPVTETTNPLTSVDSSGSVPVSRFVLSLFVGVVNLFTQCFLFVLICKIL